MWPAYEPRVCSGAISNALPGAAKRNNTRNGFVLYTVGIVDLYFVFDINVNSCNVNAIFRIGCCVSTHMKKLSEYMGVETVIGVVDVVRTYTHTSTHNR